MPEMLPELPRAHDRIESRPTPRRPWVPPALTLESVDHTNAAKAVAYPTELYVTFGPAS